MIFKSNSEPPKMSVRQHLQSIHGYELEDPYYWFRDKDDPEVLPHLKAENSYTNSLLEPFSELKDSIWNELKGRIKEDDQSYPTPLGDYFYYTKDLAGQEHKVYCRRKGSMEAPEEVILDLNELAKDKAYLKLGVFEVSPNNKILAYSLDVDGSEKFTIYFKDLESGQVFEQQLTNAYYSLEWTNDSESLYFVELNDKQRPDKVYNYKITDPPKNKSLIYQEPSDEFFVSLYKAKNKNKIFVHCYGAITQEVHWLDANSPKDEAKVVLPREHGVEYSAEDSGKNSFIILINKNAPNFKVIETSIEDPSSPEYKEIIAHREDVYIDNYDVFQSELVLIERCQGLKKLRFVNLADLNSKDVELPEENCEVSPYSNPNFEANEFLFSYSSLINPPSVMKFSFANGNVEVLKTKEVPTYEKSQYVTERVFAQSEDGTQVPLSLVYKKGLKKDGSNPCYLYGYGSYGLSMPPTFRTTIFSLVDRGFVFALAHIRGGSEMGRQWYESGKLLKKKNTFKDFIACGEYLIKEGFTKTGEIAACGGSAGGLLMGTCMNWRPDLFKVIAAHVPFVDVVNTMLDDSLPLTTLEYDEWGNPHDKEYFDYIRSYSPYDNVTQQKYPHVFITAGLNDPRVTYWEPAKWTQKLRENQKDKNHLIALKTNLEAGHGGKSGRFEGLKEYAEEYTFILAAFDRIE